jgi:hypothetical protein
MQPQPVRQCEVGEGLGSGLFGGFDFVTIWRNGTDVACQVKTSKDISS